MPVTSKVREQVERFVGAALSTTVTAVTLLLVLSASAKAQEERPWEHPAGPACFEEWIALATTMANSYVSPDDSYNRVKPYRYNEYGIRVHQVSRSVGPPDDWAKCGGNKHWWMWTHYGYVPGFEPPGLPQLQQYVRECIRRAETGVDEPASGAACPLNFQAYRYRLGFRLSCRCSPSAMAGRVWGTLVYTDDSSICTAARHAGACGPEGGLVDVEGRAPLSSYVGSTRNGITSSPYNAAWPWAFFFPSVGSGEEPARAPQCPGNFMQYRGTNTTLRCYCPAEAMTGRVWGTYIYTDDSSVCAAARHAGAAPAGGATVRVQAREPQPSYAGSTQNGVTSSPYNTLFPGSFWFPDVAAGEPGAPAGAPTPPTPGEMRDGIDFPGGDLYRVTGPELCKRLCDLEPQCRAWTYVKPGVQGPQGVCWLKRSVSQPVQNPSCISGVKGGG